MAPQANVEIVILKLKFLPFMHPQCSRISLTRNKHFPSRTMHEVRSWFDDVIFRERSKIAPNLKVRYCEWKIKSGNPNLFQTNGYRYDKILVILGEERVHWLFYTNIPLFQRVQGWAFLPVSYCGCCLYTHYLKIIETIKDWMVE